MSFILPDPSNFQKLTESQIKDVLNVLFEPCETLNSYFYQYLTSKEFRTYSELIELCRLLLDNLLNEYQKNQSDTTLKLNICKIVSAHPRLGVPKKQVSSELSVYSKNEQKSLNSDNNKELADKLINLNKKYEETFPGLIFVVFVNGRSRDEIMRIMEKRIASSTWLNEVNIAFNQMCDIALDRANKLNAKL